MPLAYILQGCRQCTIIQMQNFSCRNLIKIIESGPAVYLTVAMHSPLSVIASEETVILYSPYKINVNLYKYHNIIRIFVSF